MLVCYGAVHSSPGGFFALGMDRRIDLLVYCTHPTVGTVHNRRLRLPRQTRPMAWAGKGFAHEYTAQRNTRRSRPTWRAKFSYR